MPICIIFISFLCVYLTQESLMVHNNNIDNDNENNNKDNEENNNCDNDNNDNDK